MTWPTRSALAGVAVAVAVLVDGGVGVVVGGGVTVRVLVAVGVGVVMGVLVGVTVGVREAQVLSSTETLRVP